MCGYVVCVVGTELRAYSNSMFRLMFPFPTDNIKLLVISVPKCSIIQPILIELGSSKCSLHNRRWSSDYILYNTLEIRLGNIYTCFWQLLEVVGVIGKAVHIRDFRLLAAQGEAELLLICLSSVGSYFFSDIIN